MVYVSTSNAINIIWRRKIKLLEGFNFLLYFKLLQLDNSNINQLFPCKVNYIKICALCIFVLQQGRALNSNVLTKFTTLSIIECSYRRMNNSCLLENNCFAWKLIKLFYRFNLVIHSLAIAQDILLMEMTLKFT